MTLRSGNVVHPKDGPTIDLGYTRLRLLLSGEDTDGAFALTEQPLEGGALAGPLHTHANEDGFIYVLAGRLGAQVAEQVIEVERGGVIVIPRGVRHTFWNPTSEESTALEFFAPAGLEAWFRELAQLVAAEVPDVEAIVTSARRHGTYLDLGSLEPLLDEHGLHLPGL